MITTTIIDGIKPDSISGLGGANEGHILGFQSDIMAEGGVVDSASGRALVTENSPAGMSVLVADGVVYVPNDDYAFNLATETKNWRVVINNESAKTVTANSSGSTRIDLVCVKVDKTVTPNEYGTNVASIVVVAGTPGAGVPATPANHYKLAEITVANGATSIVNANIKDMRRSTAFTDTINTGWNGSPHTWVYVSATSIKIEGIDLTAIYRKGTKIVLKQGGGNKYFVVGSSAFATDTTINFIPSTDYTVANAAITDNFYSHIENPEGFPQFFNFVPPSFSGSGSMTYTSVATDLGKWSVSGKLITLLIQVVGTTGGTASNTLNIGLPVTSVNTTGGGALQALDGSGTGVSGHFLQGETIISCRKYDASNFGLGAIRGIRGTIIYEF